MLLREFINNIQLQELFNFSYPYHLIVDNYYLSFDYWEKKYEATTKIGKLHVLFMIKKTIIIEFSIEGAYDITGLANGEQFRILSTVWNIISNELPKLIDDTIHTVKFTAEHNEPSRVSLYRRVAPKITTLLGSEWKRSEDEDEDSIIFLWQQQQPNNQTLTELFNFSYPYKLAKTVTDNQYIQKQYIASTPIGQLKVDISKNINVIDFSFSINDQYNLTGEGKGEQFRILGTVSEIIKNHLLELIDDDVKMIYFDADSAESSRISLYKRIAPKITKLLGSNWKFKIDDVYGNILYIWEKDMKIKELVTESLSREDAGPIIDKFLEFAKSQLGLEQLPKINTISDSNYSIQYRSFGGYNPETRCINVMSSNRHIQDLLRTLAHELVHFKQDLANQLDDDSGTDGSPQENEANAQAAIVMRKWAKLHPNLFSYEALE